MASHFWITTNALKWTTSSRICRCWLAQTLMLFLCATQFGHCSFDQNVFVASTICPEVSMTLRPFKMLREFIFSETICDETAEYEAIAQMHHSAPRRVYIIIISFPSNCLVLSSLQKRLRLTTVIILVGCEEITWKATLSSDRPIMLQMTTPSWYPARILHHIAEHAGKQQSRTLITGQTCQFEANHILREDADIVHQYLELSSNSEEQMISDILYREFFCLSIGDFHRFPVMKSSSSESPIELFVKDKTSTSTIISSINSSRNLMQICRDSGKPTNIISYVNDQNLDLTNLFTQDIKTSFSIGKMLISQDGIFWTGNDSDPWGRIDSVLQDFQSVAKIFAISENLFVQLHDWKISRVTFTENSTEIFDTFVVDVRSPLTLFDDGNENQTANNSFHFKNNFTSKSLFGFRFFAISGSVHEPSEATTSGQMEILEIYLPVGICTFVLVVFLLIFAAYSRQRYLKTHLSQDRAKFFVDSDDLTPLAKRTNTVQSVNSVNNSRSTNGFLTNNNNNNHETHKSLASIQTGDSYGEKEMGLSAGDNYAKFNGEIVFLRYIRTKHLQLKSSTRQFISNMRDIRGDNINGFVALFVGCSSPFRPPAVVFEYSARGSLMDLIDKEEIKLDWSFKVSFLTDLVRGLKIIHHSSIKFHGRLTSRRCVIDNRWTLKITDYGISRLEQLQNGGKSVENLSDEQLLWTAPEILRSTTNTRDGSPKGDVYSIGIIMQELILRGRPFCTSELSTKEIIGKIRHPPPLLRPHVSNQTAQPEAITIMKECWTENPELRPTVDEVVAKFKALNQGRKVNIVDSMFVMLEKYSNNLEDLIHERTEELNEEKRKTEQLLYRMMPQTVAEKLKLGEPVEPESFADVTIYFSDIVGFTTISAHSTPMEVVNLLNDLYSLFDSTLSYYDVYKVETIGDAYMVVSGLPVANGNRHAGEIASVALDLLYQCSQFKIRHLYEVPLLLRIGIHTGSCAAGVVGLTMPRYCLFGDTVNTASRMESTSRAYRIHVSEESQRKLMDLGGYKMVLRGSTFVKGKGDMQTFWLEGKNGFDKLLPQPAPDTGESHGLDEKIIIRGRELQTIHDKKQIPNGTHPLSLDVDVDD